MVCDTSPHGKRGRDQAPVREAHRTGDTGKVLHSLLRADEALPRQVAQGETDTVSRLRVSGERCQRQTALCTEASDGPDEAYQSRRRDTATDGGRGGFPAGLRQGRTGSRHVQRHHRKRQSDNSGRPAERQRRPDKEDRQTQAESLAGTEPAGPDRGDTGGAGDCGEERRKGKRGNAGRKPWRRGRQIGDC